MEQTNLTSSKLKWPLKTLSQLKKL